jgi:hypothetical protein
MNAKRYLPRAMMVFAAMLLLWTLSGATYGPVAALLSEYFPGAYPL